MLKIRKENKVKWKWWILWCYEKRDGSEEGRMKNGEFGKVKEKNGTCKKKKILEKSFNPIERKSWLTNILHY